MSKMSKAIAVLGVVAGLGVAAMPLSSYAASQDIEQAKVQVEVGGAINLTLDKAASDTTSQWDSTSNTLDLGKIMVGATDPTEGTITATVETNDPLGYTLSIKALNNAEMVGSNGGSIESNNLSGGKGWAYKTSAGSWTALTTTDVVISAEDAATTTKTPAPAEDAEYKADATTDVTFGVKADSTVAEGTYTGTVVFTAAVK